LPHSHIVVGRLGSSLTGQCNSEMLATQICRSARASRSLVGLIGTHPHGSGAASMALVRRCFSSKDEGNSSTFRPRRKSSRNYRPLKAGGVKKKKDWSPANDHKFVDLSAGSADPKDELEATFGAVAAGVLKDMRHESLHPTDAEDDLRLADYWTAESGTTEEKVFERRALARQSPEERARFFEDIDEAIREGESVSMDFEDDTLREYKDPSADDKNEFNHLLEDDGMDEDDDDDDNENRIDVNQLAHGEWSEMLVGVNRSIKLWRGGRLESYRALMIAGNCNGCGGFGIGKSPDPIKAVTLAGRKAKRNIFFVDRYQGDGLTQDLVGKMNSTKVIIRATDNGLRGNELCTEILKRFGITNAAAKAYGNRHPWNVVRATMKALLTHESIEDIALKRGKRLVSVDRAMRMQI
jgi:small subunit ribosomal protein S5